MITIRRILCPVDFSEYSRGALRHAVALARWHQATVTVLHVEDMLLGAARAEISLHAQFPVGVNDELRAFVADAGCDRPGVSVLTTVGDAVNGILERAKQDSSDLIVMGTRGRSGVARLVLGSVTERVVRQSMCPVMTIPPAAHADAPTELERFDPVLCASDFSPSCRMALDLALSVAQEADARLILLHALQVPQVESGRVPMPRAVNDVMDTFEIRRQALARLERGLPSDAVFRCRPESLVVEGDPADAILRVAHNENAKLIVMGVQARSAIDRLLFGSITRGVMQAARCPVLSVRAHQAAEPWADSSMTGREIGAATA
jgi:nucleotide-binding universal stress UspA family protein